MASDFITFTKNVFIPVTNMCRNNCAYCGFRREIGSPEARIIPPGEALATLEKAAALDCKEALFTYGDAPQDPRFSEELEQLGYATLTDYVYDLCARAIDLGILPHTNGGVLPTADLKKLWPVNASMGLMLETTAKLPAHQLSPLKDPAVRLKFMEEAGHMGIPFTTGILVGIGESREDRKASLEAIRDLHLKYDHIQEVIVQNFVPKPYIRMADVVPPTPQDMVEAIRLAREILPADISLQAPPNLTSHLEQFLSAGAEDVGGISPVTLDYINPECAWPSIDALKARGFKLKERLPVYPKYVRKGWYGTRVKPLIEKYADEEGYCA
ncbi:7,8-didemethyl-8-hydroxy-5-deazariboflavin synthase subunit CofG [Methanocella sp. MCL-LM]|uniref:7,8-didemethyl-8-hydroxy-5-deazariboflavin synthase subunit CofG n=1 Tax=Methanocella sp. MCL-LM TaxID=3412035 RepID=UPI003C776CE5